MARNKKSNPEDYVPSIDNKCPTCGALPDELCTEGPDHAPRQVELHPHRTAAGLRLQALNQNMAGAIFGGGRKRGK